MSAKMHRRKGLAVKGFADFRHNTMEQAEKEMNESPKEQETLRKYLLGDLPDKEEMLRIEKKSLLDDDFDERISVAEDELIEEYLDGALPVTERERFLKFFLISQDRKEKLRLIRDLRKYAGKSAAQQVGEFSEEKKAFFDWRGLLAMPALRFAALALIVFGLGFAVWRVAVYQSDASKGVAQLQTAFRGQRPTESRPTINFGYAPFSNTRGEKKNDVTDARAYRRAGEFLRNATEGSPDAEAFHAQGLLYLAEKKFDEALDEFNRAARLAPDNAKLQSDLGAVYLEKAKSAKESGKESEVAQNINLSLEHLNRALELDENLPEALFNKALVLQKIPSPEQAREAWGKYLEKDSTSEWADEARSQLKKLESQKSQNLDADELEKAFLTAFRQKDEVVAAQLISQNRELIKTKYLPQKLAMSLVQASAGEKDEYLQALILAGKLEEKNIGDSFAKDLASFYAKISDSNLESLKQAQISLQNSYQRYLDGKTGEAFEEASRARELFLQAGDVYEAKLSEFIIAYCRIKNDGAKDSLQIAEEIVDFCRRGNYKWLLSNILYWLGGAQRSLGERAKAKDNYKHCLALAEETKDAQVTQKILVTLARQNKFVGQNTDALNYLQRAFDEIEKTPTLALREKWRTYSASIEILSSLKLYSLATAVSLENIKLANELEDSSFIADSQLDAGIVHAETGDFAEARSWLIQAKQNAGALPESADRTAILAKSLLTLGYLERRLDNYSQAEKFYDEALSIVENKEVPFFLYEIEKSRLLTNISLNKDREIEEEQITKIIGLAENYRHQIASEQERISFFNNQQDIYDIVVAYEFNHARYEQAYNYLETSNARSLLSWLKKGNVNVEKKQIEAAFNETFQPLRLDEIRAQMPDRVQILQYAVLEDKVLIWLVSKDNVTVVSSNIGSQELKEKVTAYIERVSRQDNQKQEEAKKLARELYDWLIRPVAEKLDPQREICLIPQKTLFHLPFAALIAPDEKIFLAQFNFFYAPSANVFLLSTENARQKSALTDETFLSIGNPLFDQNYFRDFNYLPDAETEALEITKYYTRKQTLIGPQATKTAVQDSLQNAEVINYAGHYLVKHGEPLASGLLLTKAPGSDNAEDGVLTNAELINRKLPQLKLVVLSACETGVEQYYNGEGLVGLSTTFLKAGAPLVVASQWKVDSGASAELMKKFHFLRTQEKLSTMAALRRAQLEMTEAPDGRFRQPYFWAAFATYGGYAEF
jgi:CHAT domain-containing protein/tetratricopeptide (TPR) repeat protein